MDAQEEVKSDVADGHVENDEPFVAPELSKEDEDNLAVFLKKV